MRIGEGIRIELAGLEAVEADDVPEGAGDHATGAVAAVGGEGHPAFGYGNKDGEAGARGGLPEADGGVGGPGGEASVVRAEACRTSAGRTNLASMELDVFWHPPIDLREDHDDGLILTCELEKLPEEPGVYAFCRTFGDKIEPLYIGRAADLRSRIKGHFKGSVRLMNKIKDAKIGQKVVLAGEWRAKPGQSAHKALAIIESALIKYAIAEGHDLLNVVGARTPVHTINSSGNREASSHLFRKAIMAAKK